MCSNHNHSHSHSHTHDHSDSNDHCCNHNHSHSDGYSHDHDHENGCCACGHQHSHSHNGSKLSLYRNEIISALILLGAVMAGYFGVFSLFGSGAEIAELAIYIIALIPVGIPILKETFELLAKGNWMNEFTLMVGAAVGAFAIGEYPEGVAVLLFYSFGEKMEDTASEDVKRRIKNLLNQLPDSARVKTPDGTRDIKPSEVNRDDIIIVRPGERVPVDGILLGNKPVDFDTAAITGESVPRAFNPNAEVASGCIPVDKAVELRASRAFEDSSMTRLLRITEEAQAAKSPTETMLRRITRWYTPVVFLLAILLFFIPWIMAAARGMEFNWMMWLRRALVFLVCSCPCALVVSVPLSYFASLGTASKKGLLFKGSRFVDSLRKVDTVIFDKTGTLTTGDFSISSIFTLPHIEENELLSIAAAVDAGSAHPLAKAVVAEASKRGLLLPEVNDVVTIPHGMKATLKGEVVLIGSRHLMEEYSIEIESHGEGSEICVALNGDFLGAIYLVDKIRNEAVEAISKLHKSGTKVIILSGDRPEAVARVAHQTGADDFRAEMTPEGKKKEIDRLTASGQRVAFVGDGINDAPAIAAAEVGIAMGTMGTAIAMDTADMVIASDNLLKLPEGVALAYKVRRIVMGNISFALGVKALVMILGAFGIATLWAAVFADTGVTLITIAVTLLALRK